MKRMFTTILLLLVVLVGLVAVVALIGAALPRNHTASRSVLLHRPRTEVYALVRDFESAPSWRKDVQRVEMLPLSGGRVGFREVGKHDAVTYEVSADIPRERLVTTITSTDLGYSGSWTYQFADEAGGTRLTITENGDVSNVLFRFMSRYVFGHTATIDSYLNSLAQRMGEKNTHGPLE
jgi:uncharacterized protein YndB with AHSA1/START domain